MKYKRQKKVQRILKFFKVNYGHHPPFQLLIDGTFTRACLLRKVNIKEQIPHYLGEEVKIITTRCCLLELERLVGIESDLYGALQVLKQFPLHECGHGHTDEERRPSAKCIRSMIAGGNPKRYFVASQGGKNFRLHFGLKNDLRFGSRFLALENAQKWVAETCNM